MDVSGRVIDTFLDRYCLGKFKTVEEFYSKMPEGLAAIQDNNTIKRIENRFQELYPKTNKKIPKVAFMIVPGEEASMGKSGRSEYFLFQIPEAATKTESGTARDAYFFDYVVAHEIGETITLERFLANSEELANCVAREIVIGCDIKQYQSLCSIVKTNIREFPLKTEKHPNIQKFRELGFSMSHAVVLSYTICSLPEYSKKYHKPWWDWELFYKNLDTIETREE